MSAPGQPLSRAQTCLADPGRAIDLADNTAPTNQEEFSEAELDDLLPNILKKTPSWVNPARVREELQKRKFAKYSEARYKRDTTGEIAAGPSSTSSDIPAAEQDAILSALTRTRTFADGKLQRGQQKLNDMIGHRNRLKSGADSANAEIDILYENQRGSWLFGQPLFSSKSLLNFDPSAWTTAAGTRSAVNITNAQLPDPSWEWAWKSWYVDMSLDVDEQGWQYNFMFNNNFAWHGVHPWFHSFVRRRRWIRKRTRTSPVAALVQSQEPLRKGRQYTHKLNADYFSVRAAAGAKTHGTSTHDFTLSQVHSGQDGFTHSREPEEGNEVDDIQTLLTKLKQSTMDREKLNYILEYMKYGENDTHRFADKMPHIMSTLIFQHSRRQLLASMLQCLEKQDPLQQPTHSHRDDKQSIGVASDLVKRKHENLVRAVQAADKEIKNLEYWSDVSEVKQEGRSLGTAEAITESDVPHEPGFVVEEMAK